MHHSKALVTGASSGLGRALCKALAAEGVALFITGQSRERLEELAQELPEAPLLFAADLTSEKERSELILRMQDFSPDLVINNAGFGLYGEALSHKTEEQLAILHINATAALHLSLEAARLMRAQSKRGTIVNIASAAAFFAYPTFSVYAAAKRFILQFSQAFDDEMKPYGIRSLTACPGQIATSFRLRASKGLEQKKDRRTLSAEKAAAHILHQIKGEKSVSIFDMRYKIGVALARLLPGPWARALLRSAIATRYDN